MNAREKLALETSTDDGVVKWLDETVGVGNYTYDPDSDLWVVPDSHFAGPGRRFILIQRGGFFDVVLVPEEALT